MVSNDTWLDVFQERCAYFFLATVFFTAFLTVFFAAFFTGFLAAMTTRSAREAAATFDSWTAGVAGAKAALRKARQAKGGW